MGSFLGGWAQTGDDDSLGGAFEDLCYGRGPRDAGGGADGDVSADKIIGQVAGGAGVA